MNRLVILFSCLACLSAAIPASADQSNLSAPPPLAPGNNPPPPKPLDPAALEALKLALTQGDFAKIQPFFDARTVTEFGHGDTITHKFVRESIDYGIGGFMQKIGTLHTIMGTPDQITCKFSGQPAMTVICFASYSKISGRAGIMIFGENNHLYMDKITYLAKH